MKNVPKLRFKDDNGRDFPAWITEFLLSLSENGFSNGVFNDPSKVGSGYKLVNVSDMYIESTIDERNLTLVNIDYSEFVKNKVEKGDVFFTRSSLVKEGIACSNVYLGESQDITFDGHLVRMRPKKNLINSVFLNYLLKTKEVRKQLVARGKTATMTTIGQSDIATVNIIFPSANKEQTKIADFLTAIDDRISQLSQKCDGLAQYKKGVMQKIFSQELRFKDENGRAFPAWEEKRLGDVSSFFSGGTPLTTNRTFYDGNIPFIKSGEINSSSTAQFITESGLNNSSAKIVMAGDLLYALYGATSGEVAISKINGAINQAVLCIRSEIDTYFLYSYLFFEKQSILEKYLQGGQGNLSADIIKSLKIPTPSKPEQEKVAGFLSAVDEKINQAQAQLDALKQYKQGLLQQMFV